MALQKRINYGFNGYEAPPIPRAARSARRHLFKKKANESQMCAFDLLATVAGKLLLDGENPPPNPPGKDQPMTVRNSIEKEEKDEDKPLEDRDCYERNFLITEIVSKAPTPNHSPDKLACNQNDTISRPASGVTSSDGSEKIGSDEQLVNDECKLSLGISTPSVDIESSGFRFSAHSGSSGSDDDMRKDVKPDPAIIRNLSISHKASQFGSGHAEASDWKSSALVCSVDSVKFPFCRDGSFPVNGDNVKLVTKDDDENSSECIELRNKAFKPPEEHSFRKFLAPKITSNVKDDEDVTERCSYLNRRNGMKRQRPLQDYPFKKRKLYNCGMASNSDESITGDGNGENDDGLGYVPSTPAAVAATPTSAGGYASSSSRNSQVKLRIKSFRVPELFIEIPESATVGSLKRMVMDSVNTVLGDGLHVGVLLQGKRIKDDSKTLLQSGISHDKRLDTLGFSLERSPTPATIRSYPEDCPNPVVCENPQPLARYASPLMITENGGQQGNQEIHINNFIESDHDSAPSPPGLPLQRATPVKQDALAIVPLRKSKRTESTQRRIRRPFTVAEVEALVQAVEKLGTGRWRDVKLRAFDNAKHRTYVDLKDKWKTLVHTAGISPQQRRGEPVPQELLDRVLTAHAYWSHHQPKHHLNSHPLSALFL